MDTIRIGEKYYNGDTVTETAKTLLLDIQKVENELGRISLRSSITNLAKATLIEKLIEETVNLEEVEKPTTVKQD